MLARLPPQHSHVILVGFTNTTSGRTCPRHPGGCGDVLVMAAPEHGVGMLLRLRFVTSGVEGGQALAAHTINADGSDGCRVGFAKRVFVSTRGREWDGRTVRIVDVYHSDHQNPACRAEYHRNCGFAHGEILP
jgi:hypothetical protein